MRSSRIRRHAAELDVTAFINLIVVLVIAVGKREGGQVYEIAKRR